MTKEKKEKIRDLLRMGTQYPNAVQHSNAVYGVSNSKALEVDSLVTDIERIVDNA